MTCQACGDELAGRRNYGAFHRTCVNRVLTAMRGRADRQERAAFPQRQADK